jgi:tRNA dimethylallyltransferase
MKKQRLIILAGPTASGKTDLAVALAKALNGEVISADSMQVYRGMDIGTAKVTEAEMQGVPHHLIDVIGPDEEWNVMEFCRRAEACIREIAARGRQPIVAGGTGFYIHALAYGAEFDEEEENDIRRRLEARDPDDLYRELQEKDPAAAEAIHPHNVKRVVRALEYWYQTGRRISDHNAALRRKESPYALCYLVLNMDRAKLYERIEQRVDRMLEDGLGAEVEGLLRQGARREWVSMQGLGYKEIAAYLQGEITREEAVTILKRDTRRFAKRQLTWFRREPEAIFVDCEPRDTLLSRTIAVIEATFEPAEKL